MNGDDCLLLDDYLDGDLTTTERNQFRNHLPHCESCQTEVRQQRWMEGLLRESSDLVALPAELSKISLRPPSKSIPWRAAVATAIAASMLLALTIGYYRSDHTMEAPQESVAEHNEPGPTEQQPDTRFVQLDVPKVPPAASFVAEDDVIVVPVDSGSPEVSIIQVYPTAQARSRWRREALLETSFASNSGG